MKHTPNSFSKSHGPMSLVRILRRDGLLIGLVRRDGSQRAAHVRVENLESVDIAGIDPSEPKQTLAFDCSTRGKLDPASRLTLHVAHP